MIGTYTELQTAVGNWLNRSDLTARIPEFIQLAEAEFNRTIWTPQSEEVAAVAANGALPSDFRAVRHVYISSDPKTPLEQVSPSYLRLHYGDSTTGTPVVYSLINDTMAFGPLPATGLSAVLDYYQSIPALASNSTNWLLTAHPDIYLFGTLVQAEAFVWNDERLPVWRAGLTNALEQLDMAGNKRRWGGGPLIRKGTAFW